MEVADHESRGHWAMATKLTVPTDARAYFQHPVLQAEIDSLADYKLAIEKADLPNQGILKSFDKQTDPNALKCSL